MDAMLINHVVLVGWRQDVPQATLTELGDLVGKFADGIPGVLGVAYGPSVSPEELEAGYDWGLVVTFVDAASRDGYLSHPVHAPVATIIRDWNERLVVFDLAF